MTAEAAGVIIRDRGDRREITITGPHMDMCGFREDTETFETRFSMEFLESLRALGGVEYFKDEINRSEDPAYILEPMREALCPLVDLGSGVVMDFGCGGGGSSVCLCRLGAREVHGVEIDESLVRLARLRARDSGFGDTVTVHHFERTDHLPFDDGAFDVVICNAVLEHIHPRDRGAHLREVWRTLAAGGFLFVFETPNRLWPMDGHTTGLPFIPYLPVRLARRYAILFSERVGPHDSVEDLIARGIRGVTYWEIKRRLAGSTYVPNNDIARYFGSALPGESTLKRMMKAVARSGYRILEGTVCRVPQIPVAALLPRLSLCFKKDSVERSDVT